MALRSFPEAARQVRFAPFYSIMLLIMVSAAANACQNPRSAVYQRLHENLERLTVRISLSPFPQGQKDPEGGMRSVLLHHENLVIDFEPHAKWSDGSFATGNASVSSVELLALIDELERRGAWEKAQRYYSSRTIGNPAARPPAGMEYSMHKRVMPSLQINASYIDGAFYDIVVVVIPWGDETVETLEGLQGLAAPRLLEALVQTSKRFR
jgi:hypothetical protein